MSRTAVSMVRAAWLARMLVACTTLLSMAVRSSMSVRGTQPPYWCTSAVMVVTFRVWPVGVTPSVSGVVAFGRLSYRRNSMVLPLFAGIG